MENETLRGTIKINSSRFYPVIQYLSGRVLWGGTKKERPGYYSIEVMPSQQKWAFDNLNKEIEFIKFFPEDVDYEYAKIINI